MVAPEGPGEARAGVEYLVGGPGHDTEADHSEGGVWFGSGLPMVGIASGSRASEADVRAVFGQLRHPSSTREDPVFLGRPPRSFRPVADRIAAACAAEPDAGEERRAEIADGVRADRRKAVAYYDLTFSPVKSVSVYWAALLAAGREDEANRVVAAHTEAVGEAMAWAEKEVAWTRVGYHGRTGSGRSIGRYEAGTGLVWTRWDHHTNRACEPQLHAHVAVLNRIVTSVDGVVRALDGRGFRAVKHGIDAIYAQSLERRLSESCGVVFDQRPDGKAREIVGIDQSLLTEASSRHSAVVDHLESLVAEYRVRHGHDPGPSARSKLARQAVLATREAKSHQPVAEQIGAWCAPRSERLHTALTAARNAVRTYRDQRNQPEVVPDVVLRVAVEAVQARHATWDRGLLMAAIAEHVPGCGSSTGSAVDLSGLAQRVLTEPARFGFVQVNATEPGGIPLPEQLRRSDGGSVLRPFRDQRYATVDQLAVETRILALAAAHSAPALDAAQLVRVRARCDSAGLSPDQAAAVIGIAGSERVGEVLIGPAGTGKSHTLGTLAETWRQETGGRVLGLATSQIATLELADNGLDAMNIARFLHRTANAQPDAGLLRSGDLVVVDEVGMTSTADLAQIIKLAAGAGARVVFTGDPEQLAAIEAGGMVGLLAADNGCFALTEVHRFAAGWEQDASLRLRDGDEQVLAVYDLQGRLIGGTAEEMTDRAVRAYLADTLEGRTSLLVTSTNHQAAELSGRIQSELVRLGRVDPRVVCLDRDGNPIAAGDLIQARRNDSTVVLIDATASEGGFATVTNRATYHALGPDPFSGGVRITDTAGRTGVLPLEYVAEHVTLGYAATVWAAQGRTVDTCHALLEPGATRRAAYVSLTRGRERNTAYVVCVRDGDEHQHEPLDTTARAQLAAILSNVDDDITGSAEHARRAHALEARSLAWIVGQWDLITTEATRADCDRTVQRLLPAATAQRVLVEPGYRRLCRAVRGAELAGHDPTALLEQVISERSLFNADSISDVLRWRIHTTTATRTPEPDANAGWATTGRTGQIADYLDALATAAHHRQTQLGIDTLHDQPSWAVEHLGPAPTDHADRQEWARRAGIIAAYRDLAGIDDTSTSLGAPPSREQPLHRTLWQQAIVAAGTPADTLDYTTATDHELREMRAAYQHQLTYAPAFVHDELRDARMVADGYRTDAILWAAEADLLTPGTPERARADEDTRAAEHLAGVYTRRADRLAATAQAREHWYTRTASDRARYEMAGDQLVRRGHPRHLTTAEAEQLALLAPDLAPNTTTSHHRPEHRTITDRSVRDAEQQTLFGRPDRDRDRAGVSLLDRAVSGEAESASVVVALTAVECWTQLADRVQRWLRATPASDHDTNDSDCSFRRRLRHQHHEREHDLTAERADDLDYGIGD